MVKHQELGHKTKFVAAGMWLDITLEQKVSRSCNCEVCNDTEQQVDDWKVFDREKKVVQKHQCGEMMKDPIIGVDMLSQVVAIVVLERLRLGFFGFLLLKFNLFVRIFH